MFFLHFANSVIKPLNSKMFKLLLMNFYSMYITNTQNQLIFGSSKNKDMRTIPYYSMIKISYKLINYKTQILLNSKTLF